MTKPIVRFGNRNFSTQLLNEDRNGYVTGTFKTYEDTLVDIKITPVQEIKETAANDNPAALQDKGIATVDIQANVLGMKTEDLAALTGAIVSNKGVFYGSSDSPVVNFGFFVDSTVNDGSIDKIIVYNCVMTNPPINLRTNTKEEKGRENVQLNMKGNIIKFEMTDGSWKDVTHVITNSVKNAAFYNFNLNQIKFPEEQDII